MRRIDRKPIQRAFIRILACSALGCAPMFQGCQPELGTCDQTAALAQVEGPGGTLYAGQAMLHISCGNGSFCHSVGASGDARHGVPFGLDFDMRPAADAEDEEGLLRLRRGQMKVREWRHAIWKEVHAGRMPPKGTWTDGLEQTSQLWTWVGGTTSDGASAGQSDGASAGQSDGASAGQSDGSTLPTLTSSEGQEILRNWLACSAPAQEVRTGGPDVEASWEAVYAQMAPTCVACHNDSMLSAGLSFGSDACDAWQALVDQPASSSEPCAGRERVVAGDPDDSVLLHKVDPSAVSPELCGMPMPSVGPEVLEALRSWIAAGAPPPAGCQ